MYTRRDFIKSALRQTSLAVIVMGGGYLIFREHSEDECNYDFVCRNCKKLSECSLPESKDHKKLKHEGSVK